MNLTPNETQLIHRLRQWRNEKGEFSFLIHADGDGWRWQEVGKIEPKRKVNKQ